MNYRIDKEMDLQKRTVKPHAISIKQMAEGKPRREAVETFRRKPYEIPKADLVTGSVTEYIAGKYGIKEADDGRGQTQTQIPDDRRP